MDMGDRPPIEGRAALLEVYQATFDTSTFKPFVHNHVIKLAGDRASGVAYVDLRYTAEGKSMIGSGFYTDEYVRVGDGWKFKSRRLTTRFLVPLLEGWAEASGK